MSYPENRRPAAVDAAGLANIENGRAGEFDSETDTQSPNENQGLAGEYGSLSAPTHPDAEALWPILFPLFAALIAARFDLEACFPRQSRLCGRMASALYDQMIDAELGLLRASPEQRVAHAERRVA